jgi:thioesterase domain-containing protein
MAGRCSHGLRDGARRRDRLAQPTPRASDSTSDASRHHAPVQPTLPEPGVIEVVDPPSLERYLRETIPMARAMDLRVADYDGYRLALAAPLAPNVNDKGCAFGGSIASVLTLAGWGLAMIKLGEAGLAADIYVQEVETRYLAPIFDEMVGEAWAPDNTWPLFLDHLREHGKARIGIDAEIAGSDGAGIAARQSGRYVAKVPQR